MLNLDVTGVLLIIAALTVAWVYALAHAWPSERYIWFVFILVSVLLALVYMVLHPERMPGPRKA